MHDVVLLAAPAAERQRQIRPLAVAGHEPLRPHSDAALRGTLHGGVRGSARAEELMQPEREHPEAGLGISDGL